MCRYIGEYMIIYALPVVKYLKFMQNLFLKLKTRLLAVTSNLLIDTNDAEDAVQETFCRLWQIKDRLANESETTALAITTAKNICIDQLRRKKVVRFEPIDKDSVFLADRDPVGLLELKDEYEIVKQMIDMRLSHLQKKILLMKEVDEYEIDEIAQKLGMNNSAVRMNLSRARKIIRELYLEINPL